MFGLSTFVERILAYFFRLFGWVRAWLFVYLTSFGTYRPVSWFFMGQPTHPLTQRVGRTQLWEHDTSLSLRSRMFTEYTHRALYASRLFALFLTSLALFPAWHL